MPLIKAGSVALFISISHYYAQRIAGGRRQVTSLPCDHACGHFLFMTMAIRHLSRDAQCKCHQFTNYFLDPGCEQPSVAESGNSYEWLTDHVHVLNGFTLIYCPTWFLHLEQAPSGCAGQKWLLSLVWTTKQSSAASKYSIYADGRA